MSKNAYDFKDFVTIFGLGTKQYIDRSDEIINFAQTPQDINKPLGPTNPLLLSDGNANGVQHFAWMYMTTANYDSNTAYQASDSHEKNNGFQENAKLYAEATGINYSNWQSDLQSGHVLPNRKFTRPSNMTGEQFRHFVDSIADYSNNAKAIKHTQRTGREGKGGVSPRKAIEKAAEFAKTNGISYIEISPDGNTATIRQQKMSSTQYNAFKERLKQLGDNGKKISASNSQANQSIASNITENYQQINGETTTATNSRNLSSSVDQNLTTQKTDSKTDVSKVVTLLKNNAAEVKRQSGLDVNTDEGLGKAIMQYWKENNLDPKTLKEQLPNMKESELATASKALANTNATETTKTKQLAIQK
jgi:hypothetical protein